MVDDNGLPQPGLDRDEWGTPLNNFLLAQKDQTDTNTAGISQALAGLDLKADAAATTAALAGKADLVGSTLDPSQVPDLSGGYVAQGSQTLNAASYSSLTAAITAAPDGATLLLPSGTYNANVISAAKKSLTFVGGGTGQTIIDCGSSSYGFSLGSVGANGVARLLTFRNVRFTGSTSAQILLSRTAIHTARFIDCQFDSFSAIAIQTLGTNLGLYRCRFNGSAGAVTDNAVQHLQGAQSIIMQGCQFRYCYRGFYCTSTNGAASNVDITGCTFDGGWMYLKSTASGSGGNVTYTSTALTDTTASFGALAVDSTVRAMATKVAGSVTAATPATITDSSANFVTAGVTHGDVIRTSDAWAVVDQVVSATVLKVEEWLTLADYLPASVPTVGTTYTVFGLVIGAVKSNTATAITVDAWRDWGGNLLTPAAGTLYEIAPKGDYQGIFISQADKVRIISNTFCRSWSDQISAQLVHHFIITDNNLYDGQDVGITVGQPTGDTTPGVVMGNQIHHQGSAGIWLGHSSKTVVRGNNISAPNWLSLTSAGIIYAGITVEACSGLSVAGNLIDCAGQPNVLAGISVYDTTDNVDLDDNMILNFPDHDIMITGNTVTRLTGRFREGTRIFLNSANAIGPVGQFTGSGAPTVAASVGSTYFRTDGGAGSTLYVKESGTDGTGWVAK